MNDHPSFHQLLNEYMKKNFDDLMNIKDEKNSLFNMIIAHALLNWGEQSDSKQEDFYLNDIEAYLDRVIEEQQKAYESTIEQLTNKTNHQG